MADRGKRRYKSWIYSKEAKIPKTTAWRRKQNESTRSLSSTNSNDEETSRSDRFDFSEYSLDNSASVDVFESGQCFPRCCSSPRNCEEVIESLPCSSNKEDSLDEFFSVLIDKESDSDVSDVAMCRIFGKQIRALVAITKETIMMKRAQAMGLQIPNALGNKRMMMTMFRYTKEQRYQDLGH